MVFLAGRLSTLDLLAAGHTARISSGSRQSSENSALCKPCQRNLDSSMLRSRSTPEGPFHDNQANAAIRISTVSADSRGDASCRGFAKPVYPPQAHGAHTAAANRPGDTPYTPMKLEWAALELQANYGNTNWTSETPDDQLLGGNRWDNHHLLVAVHSRRYRASPKGPSRFGTSRF